MAEVVVKLSDGRYRVYSTSVKNFITYPMGIEAMQGWILYKNLSRCLGIDLPRILANLEEGETSRPDLYKDAAAVMGEITEELPEDEEAEVDAENFYGVDFLEHMAPYFERMASYWNSMLEGEEGEEGDELEEGELPAELADEEPEEDEEQSG